MPVEVAVVVLEGFIQASQVEAVEQVVAAQAGQPQIRVEILEQQILEVVLVAEQETLCRSVVAQAALEL